MAVGIPEPVFHDEYSYLLATDTFSNGELTNPSPPFPEFFEAPHVLVTPTYQSKYPPAQGLFLALGQRLLGHPIWGVWISCGLFAGALSWMLLSWTSTFWATAITLLTVATLGTTSYWAQSYWGGMVAAAGAALVLGGMRRTLERPTTLSSLLLGVGGVLLANSRPFEGFWVCLPVAAMLGRWFVVSESHTVAQKLRLLVLPAGSVLALGFASTATYNRAVTGNYWQAPYTLHLEQYFHQGVFIFSPLREPFRKPVERLQQFHRRYAKAPARGIQLVTEGAKNLAIRLPVSIGAGFGFLMPTRAGRQHYCGVTLWLALLLLFTKAGSTRTVVLIGLLLALLECAFWLYVPAYPWPLAPFVIAGWIVTFDRERRRNQSAVFIGATILGVSFGQALVSWWSSHYVAPLVPVVLLAVATSIPHATSESNTQDRQNIRLVPAVGLLLIVHLCVLTGLSFAARPARAQNFDDRLVSREDVKRRLLRTGQSHLVFVHYDPSYTIHREWVYNSGDLANSAVIFAHDLGERRNPTLVAAYPGRSVWLLHVSSKGVRLRSYR
jgi:hypothetical protein